MIPSQTWMFKHGYNFLYQRIRRQPELLDRLGQDWAGGISLAESVRVAETLTKDNGGTLPSASWLQKNGYSGLNERIRTNRKAFSHLKQDMKRLIPDSDVVRKAEEVASANGGKLPLNKWLIKNGHNLIATRLREKPKAFAHIPRTGRQDDYIEQQVSLVGRLAKKNKGRIPHCQWLIENGHGGLDQFIRNHHALFVHLKQDTKRGRTRKEQVLIAERLAKRHGGTLPCHSWLVNNGYGGLAQYMTKARRLFAHIKQDWNGGQTDSQMVSLANSLARKHGRKLPRCGWLLKNGHSALYNRMRQKPHLFAHLVRA